MFTRVQMFHPKKLSSASILQGHRRCILGLALPKTALVIGLKKYKQTNKPFFPPSQNDRFSHASDPMLALR